MKARFIQYGTKEYSDMVVLRTDILRKPLGIQFTNADLERDKTDTLCGYFDDSEKLIGTCILTKLNEETMQLRQMAISSNSQGQNVGKRLLDFAEKTVKDNQATSIYLHARKTAVGFYLKAGYNIIGDEFTEVGIAHLEMSKKIQ